MWDEAFRGATPIEIAILAFMGAAVSLLLMVPFVWAGGKIIALKETPDRRALWTTSAAYVGAAFLCIFGGGDDMSPWFGPLVPLPGAVVIYFWLRFTYRKSWIDDDNVPEGTKLANSDWRIGLGIVVSLIAAAAVKTAVRSMASHL